MIYEKLVNVTLHCHRYLHVRWSNPIVQIFYNHSNDLGLHRVCSSKFNGDDDVVNLYNSADGNLLLTVPRRYFHCGIFLLNVM